MQYICLFLDIRQGLSSMKIALKCARKRWLSTKSRGPLSIYAAHFADQIRFCTQYCARSKLAAEHMSVAGTIHSFYRFRSTFAFVIGSTISSSKIVSSTQNRVYSIYVYNM